MHIMCPTLALREIQFPFSIRTRRNCSAIYNFCPLVIISSQFWADNWTRSPSKPYKCEPINHQRQQLGGITYDYYYIFNSFVL